MRTRGFTLVELIAVIVVLAILGAIAVPSYMDHVNQSRMIGYIEHMNTIMRVCGQYETDTGFWNGTGTITYASANQTTHALKNYFDGKPLNAFGGTWWYGANASLGMRYVSGSGLPPYGSTPESCSKFISLAGATMASAPGYIPQDEETGYTGYWQGGGSFGMSRSINTILYDTGTVWVNITQWR